MKVFTYACVLFIKLLTKRDKCRGVPSRGEFLNSGQMSKIVQKGEGQQMKLGACKGRSNFRNVFPICLRSKSRAIGQ